MSHSSDKIPIPIPIPIPNPSPSPSPSPSPIPNPNFSNSNPPSSSFSPLNRTRTLSLPEILFKDQLQLFPVSALKMMNHLKSSSNTPSQSQPPSPRSDSSSITTELQSFSLHTPAPDHTSLLSDELLLQIFSKLPISQYVSSSLVCKRWLYLHGRFVQSIKLNDWSFLTSGRLFQRFPNLSDIDLVKACIKTPRNSGILVTHKNLSLYINTEISQTNFIDQRRDFFSFDSVDKGLLMIAKWYPNLRRIVAIGAGEDGLMSVCNGCETLQELELHCCDDFSLKGISGCRNLQVVKLIGSIEGFYSSVVSDIGFTILAQGCRRLVKLELCGCEGSYDGIKAIGQCCQMLEDLKVSDHRMEGGWLAALSFCENLKTLRIESCKSIDSSPGPDEHLGCCPALEELHLEKCQMRDKKGVKALFIVCEVVREIVLQNCWGLEDEVFATASDCRRVKLLSLEGCSLLTTGGLESVILRWKELKGLSVVSCNKIKDSEVTTELATLFSVMKELKWRPDSRSLLSSNLEGTGVGNKGGRFFKRLKA